MAKRIFRMQKMLDRLEKEGRIGDVTPDALEIMKKLDGQVGTDYNWQSVVNDEPLVFVRCDAIPEGTYVNYADTEAY